MCIVPGSDKDAEAHREIDDLTQSMRTHGVSVQGRYLRGVAHKQLGHLDAALDDLTWVVEQGGVDRDIWGRAQHFRAVCLRRTGHPRAALEAAEGALKCNRNTPSTWVHRGYLHSILGDHGAAHDDYDRSLDIDPDHGLTFIYRGNGWYWQHDLDEAIADYNRVVDIFGDSLAYLTFHNRGVAKLTGGDIAGALEDLNRAERMRPFDPLLPLSPKPLACRGLAHLVVGDLEAAEHDLHESSHLGFDMVGVVAWAALEARRGRPEEMQQFGAALIDGHRDGVAAGMAAYVSVLNDPVTMLPDLHPLMA